MQRIGLIALFSLGFVVVIAGCMRLYWTHYVVEETFDVTWDGFDLWVWTAVEVNLGVICGCVPVLKPLFFPSKTGKSVANSQKNESRSASRMSKFTLGLSSFRSSSRQNRSAGTWPNDRHPATDIDLEDCSFHSLHSSDSKKEPQEDQIYKANFNTITTITGPGMRKKEDQILGR